jgi:hypothetical protein
MPFFTLLGFKVSTILRFTTTDHVITKLKNLTALYTEEEKKNTPPYSIAGEKFLDMQKRNLLLRLWLA